MRPPPRILPLAAVAVGGVLAFKALDAFGGLPALMASPSAHAEASPGGKPASGKPGAPAAAASATTGSGAPPAKPAAPVCAPSAAQLAKEAGLSPAELTVIQSLSARRGQLDAREQALDAQLQLLAAAEVKVDAKLKALEAAKAQVQALLGQADQQSQAEVDRLVVVYEKMKPRDAGAVMAQLDDRVRVPVAAKMKPAILAAVLPNMGTLEAKKLTENLARRFAAAREAVIAAAAPAAAAGTAPAKPGAAPVQATSAAPTPAASGPAAKPPAPRKLASAAPPRRRPRAPAAGAAPAKPDAGAAPAQAAPTQVGAAKPDPKAAEKPAS